MTKPMPTIMKFMTMNPLSVNEETSLVEAYKIMQDNGIRHLPVMSKGKISGILSNTDINLMKGLSHVDISEVTVSDCFTPHPYQVHPDTFLNDVMDEMAERKYGCVLVTDNEHLVGIFTWIDALKATKTLLETRLKP